jgi:hypothetical protein
MHPSVATVIRLTFTFLPGWKSNYASHPEPDTKKAIESASLFQVPYELLLTNSR